MTRMWRGRVSENTDLRVRGEEEKERMEKKENGRRGRRNAEMRMPDDPTDGVQSAIFKTALTCFHLGLTKYHILVIRKFS